MQINSKCKLHKQQHFLQNSKHKCKSISECNATRTFRQRRVQLQIDLRMQIKHLRTTLAARQRQTQCNSNQDEMQTKQILNANHAQVFQFYTQTIAHQEGPTIPRQIFTCLPENKQGFREDKVISIHLSQNVHH